MENEKYFWNGDCYIVNTKRGKVRCETFKELEEELDKEADLQKNCYGGHNFGVSI